MTSTEPQGSDGSLLRRLGTVNPNASAREVRADAIFEVRKMDDDDEEMPIWLHWPVVIISSIVGLIFITMIGTSTFAQLSTSNWDSTTGIIDDYDFFCNSVNEDGGCSMEEDIVYTYIVEDVAYTNDVTSLGWTELEYRSYIGFGLEIFDVASWDSKNDLQHIVDWFNENREYASEENELDVEYFLEACDSDGSDVDYELAECVLYTAKGILGYDEGELQDGSEIVVYHHPYDPQNSVLIPGWDGIYFVDLFLIPFSIIVPSIFLITARKKGTISDAINEFKGLAQTNMIQTNMSDLGNKAWNVQNFQPTYHESISYSQYGMSPSRMRGYESAIAYLSLNDSMDQNTVKTLVQSKFGISANDAEKFVQSTYVKSILFSNSIANNGQTPSLASTIPSGDISENLISEDESSSQELQNQLISNFQAAMQEAMDLNENMSSTNPTVDPNKETCSHQNCNNEVSFYSFQCFSCRKKFCDEHKGASIHCADCA